jgi:hypothetical protein
MKKRIFSIICWLLLCQVLLAACSSSENNPPLDFEEGYVNQQILLNAPDLFNTFNTKDPIHLEITSTSSDEIVLPNDLNLRIFERKAGDWIEILELPTTRLPAGDLILSPIKKTREITSTSPNLPDATRKYRLRIYVSGDMKTEEGIKQVAAYVDITLHP